MSCPPPAHPSCVYLEAKLSLLGLCPQCLTLRGTEQQKLMRADLHHQHTLLHRALHTWRVGAAASSSPPCLGRGGP